VKGPAHVSTSIVVTKPDGREGTIESKFDFPLPNVNGKPLHYPRSEGFVYEVKHVQDCLAQGLLESPLYTHQEMVNISETMQQARDQMGVVYPADAM